MLEKLDKIAPYAVLALLGYLTYTTITVSQGKAAPAKEQAPITRQMLQPVLIVSTAHASPVDRDPFDVSWAVRLLAGQERPNPSEANRPAPASQPATQPAAGAATEPAAAGPPSLPGTLEGVLVSEDFQAAIIGGKLYKTGELVGSGEEAQCWRVEEIEYDHIVLRFEDVTQTIWVKVAGTAAATSAPAAGGAKKEPRQ